MHASLLSLKDDRRTWLVYACLLAVVAAFYYGDLRNFPPAGDDVETFMDNAAIGEDFSYFFRSADEKHNGTGRPLAELVKYLAYEVWGNDPRWFHLLVVLLWLAGRNAPFLGDWSAWIVLSLIPFVPLTVVHIGLPRYLYVALVGTVAMIACGLQRFSLLLAVRSGKAGRVFFLGCIVALSVSAYAAQRQTQVITTYRSGRYYINREEFDTGRKMIRQAIDEGGDFIPLAQAYFHLVEALIVRGEDYIPAIEEGMAACPQDIDLRLLYGFSLLFDGEEVDRGRGESVIGKMERYAAEGGQRAFMRDTMGVLCQWFGLRFALLGDCERMTRAYRRSLRYDPGNGRSFRGLLQGLVKCGRGEEAARVARQAIAAIPGDADVLYDAVLGLEAGGEVEEASDAIRRVIAFRPDDPLFHFKEGDLYQRSGRIDAAIAAYRRAVARAPGKATYRARLGTALRAAGRLDESERAYRRAIELEPENPSLYYLLGSLVLQREERAAAMAAFERAVELGANDIASHRTLVRLLREEGRREEALAGYDRILDADLEGMNDGIFAEIGVELLGMEEVDRAEKAFRRALEMDGENLTARINLAWTLYLQRRYEEAIAENRRILERQERSRAQFNLALALLAMGDVEGARAEYARGVERFGADEAVRIGAVDDLRRLVDEGRSTEVGRELLSDYWDR